MIGNLNYSALKKNNYFFDNSLPSNSRNMARGRKNQYFALLQSFLPKLCNFLMPIFKPW